MTAGWSRRSFLRGSVLAGGLVTAPALVSGCSGLGFGNTLERIREAGVVRVGIAGERPYSYLADGTLVGAIAAVHQAIFERIGDVEVQGIRTQFGELLNGLNGGNFDVVAAGMFITVDRCEQAIFSQPVYCAKSALLVRRGNPRGLSDYASVAGKGASIVVLAGGVEENYARAAGVPNARIGRVGGPKEGLELVAAGDADAFTLTSISLRALLRRATERERGPSPPGLDDEPSVERVELLQPFIPVLDGQEERGCGGAAFRKTDEELRAAFNRELNGLRREDRIHDLVVPYGFTEAELPEEGVTTERLCRTGGVPGQELDPLPR